MGTASLFDDILKKELNIHAAWLPVTNKFEIGDYGLISDGVFVKMGNIREFGVGWTEAPGPPSTINFASTGTKMARAVGNASVQAFPNQDVDASLTIEFSRDSSFLVKAELSATLMQDIGAVAENLYELDQWRRRYRVVSAVHTGKNCVILSSKGSSSKIALSGKANALKQLDLASASAGIEASSSENIGLQIIGESGVIGLSLFKLHWLTGGTEYLAKPPRNPKEPIKIDTSSKWGKPEDDV